MSDALPTLSPEAVRAALLAKTEIALIDVREEDPYAQQHPLFAVQLSAGRIELDAPWRLPRRDVLIAVYDAGESLAAGAAHKLHAMGYSRVHLLASPDGNGLAAWCASGGEVFRDVNVPSKSFGELVEHERHTPSLSAEAVQSLIDSGANVVVLDARRFDEYQTMSIPTSTSVPGAELVLHVRDLAPDPATRVIVNCAGRTRSIIGTQSLVNAGIPNPVAALRNGTIGWTLAGQALTHGQQRRFGPASAAGLAAARASAQALADRAGAQRLSNAELAAWQADTSRTLYCWDVRTPEEYAAGHLPGFGSAPGGQLVQETDVFAAVRGARIAHWLAQLGWQVGWLTDPAQFSQMGPWQPAHEAFPEVTLVTPAQLAQQRGTLVLDFTPSAQHVKAHVPGARWALRAQLAQLLPSLLAAGDVERIVATCGSSALARFAAADLARLTRLPVAVLAGGNNDWVAEGRPVEAGDAGLASPRIDRYRRPYEGTDAPREAMQAYLDWEYGLVEQLGRDGTHGFQVLAAA